MEKQVTFRSFRWKWQELTAAEKLHSTVAEQMNSNGSNIWTYIHISIYFTKYLSNNSNTTPSLNLCELYNINKKKYVTAAQVIAKRVIEIGSCENIAAARNKCNV